MTKEFKLNLNASDYTISHCDSDKTYNGLEVHKMLCDAYIAGNNDTLDDKDEEIRKALINVFATHKDYEMFFGVSVEGIRAWLEKQGEKDKEILILKDQIESFHAAIKALKETHKIELKRQGERKHSAKNIVEAWKEMRYEVYMQASGNRHEPNYSDYTTKMFSLNDIDEIIEKMSEQEPADKVEPKFHKGEWITNGDYTWEIVEVKPLDYILQSQEGNIVDDTISHVDEQFHFFTIQDAKKGDVLTYNDNKNNVWVCIFKEYADERVYDYCTLDKESFWEYSNWNYLASFSYTPATKEQREQLEKAMTDAGYTFDFEKKKLKKIEQKPAENEELTEFDKAVGVSIGTWNPKTPEQIQLVKAVSKKLLKLAKKQINDEQKPAWSDDDERKKELLLVMCDETKEKSATYSTIYREMEELKIWLNSFKERVQPKQEWSEEDEESILEICNYLDRIVREDEDNQATQLCVQELKEWLKSIKERVQPKQEWSEGDEDYIEDLISHFSQNEKLENTKEDIVSWLKSFKDRVQPKNAWKPSDEQMKAVNEAACYSSVFSEKTIDNLISLSEQLKKLKE